ncbi:hypothetical protein IF2G_09086 [Cordyceps javanica]|nr:hypothetical protein IF2G_09086 [Cordyceps javanica]
MVAAGAVQRRAGMAGKQASRDPPKDTAGPLNLITLLYQSVLRTPEYIAPCLHMASLTEKRLQDVNHSRRDRRQRKRSAGPSCYRIQPTDSLRLKALSVMITDTSPTRLRPSTYPSTLPPLPPPPLPSPSSLPTYIAGRATRSQRPLRRDVIPQASVTRPSTMSSHGYPLICFCCRLPIRYLVDPNHPEAPTRPVLLGCLGSRSQVAMSHR